MKKKALIALMLLAVLLLCACGGGGEKLRPDADMNEAYTAVAASAELPEMAAVPESRYERAFGLNAEDCAQSVICVCAESVRVDEIWLVRAADEQAAKRVAECARSRLEQRLAEMETYLPDQYAVLKEAQLIEKGCYVAMFVSPDAARMAEVFLGAITE